MLFQNVVRQTIDILAQAECNAAWNERQRRLTTHPQRARKLDSNDRPVLKRDSAFKKFWSLEPDSKRK